MKRLVLYLTLVIVCLVSAQAQTDWRQGVWKKDIPEHFLMFDVGGYYSMSPYYNAMNPYGITAQIGYQYKVRPFVKNRLSIALGGYIGYNYYPSKDYYYNDSEIKQKDGKTFSYVPLMFSMNLYYNMKTAYLFLGIDAGVNFMLCNRDYQRDSSLYRMDETGITAYFTDTKTFFADTKDNNPLTLSRIVPSGKVYLGFMKEISTNLRVRFKAGVEYFMGYEFDYKATMYNSSINENDSGTITTVGCLDPFVTVGLVLSL
ncbi:MAG: hypothetical protein LBR28_06025 [Bacteroidales bacterium]|jgi:hypothetical protein|nr:hypothetical protein [Bacteroidales bacterium]